MILVIDNYDSFTYNLVHYFEQLGQVVHVHRNDTIPEDQIIHASSGVVLSPGPMLPENAGKLMKIIDKTAHLPVLGICLGHQALIQFYGGTLKKTHPYHGKTSTIEVKKNSIFDGLPTTMVVVRYHSWGADQLPLDCEQIAHCAGLNMAIAHNKYPHWGIQFHPESVLTDYGIEILENWLIFNQISKPKKMFD